MSRMTETDPDDLLAACEVAVRTNGAGSEDAQDAVSRPSVARTAVSGTQSGISATGDLDALQNAVGTWAGKTFPHATPAIIVEHLRDELDELSIAVLDADKPSIAEEAADILLILLHLCHRGGFSLIGEAQKKFAVCQRRRWSEPDARGVVRHIDEADDEADVEEDEQS